MIRALISGNLYGDPQPRTSQKSCRKICIMISVGEAVMKRFPLDKLGKITPEMMKRAREARDREEMEAYLRIMQGGSPNPAPNPPPKNPR